MIMARTILLMCRCRLCAAEFNAPVPPKFAAITLESAVQMAEGQQSRFVHVCSENVRGIGEVVGAQWGEL